MKGALALAAVVTALAGCGSSGGGANTQPYPVYRANSNQQAP